MRQCSTIPVTSPPAHCPPPRRASPHNPSHARSLPPPPASPTSVGLAQPGSHLPRCQPSPPNHPARLGLRLALSALIVGPRGLPTAPPPSLSAGLRGVRGRSNPTPGSSLHPAHRFCPVPPHPAQRAGSQLRPAPAQPPPRSQSRTAVLTVVRAQSPSGPAPRPRPRALPYCAG